jgi:hypothetical protein
MKINECEREIAVLEEDMATLSNIKVHSNKIYSKSKKMNSAFTKCRSSIRQTWDGTTASDLDEAVSKVFKISVQCSSKSLKLSGDIDMVLEKLTAQKQQWISDRLMWSRRKREAEAEE